MVEPIIRWSLQNRFIVILLSLLILGMGFIAASTIPLDAVPDLTNVQVQILTNSPSLGPVEVEQFITFPVENAMSGVPKVDLLGPKPSQRTTSKSS
jgi:cobalt-zinc-cadmium resistance protein CzcA